MWTVVVLAQIPAEPHWSLSPKCTPTSKSSTWSGSKILKIDNLWQCWFITFEQNGLGFVLSTVTHIQSQQSWRESNLIVFSFSVSLQSSSKFGDKVPDVVTNIQRTTIERTGHLLQAKIVRKMEWLVCSLHIENITWTCLRDFWFYNKTAAARRGEIKIYNSGNFATFWTLVHWVCYNRWPKFLHFYCQFSISILLIFL